MDAPSSTLVEFRIPLPVSMAELQIASLYTVCILSLAETGGGEGLEWVTNEPRFELGEDMTYVYNILHLRSKMPKLMRMLAPTGACEIKEETLIDFPWSISNYSNAYMKDAFFTIVETMAIDNDQGGTNNVFGLSAERLAKRKIIDIDIVNDRVDPRDYDAEFDPTLLHLEKANRGPLAANWKTTQSPITCVYKLAEIKFQWFDLQTKMEAVIERTLQGSYSKFYRMLYGTLDESFDLTMADMKELEDITKVELDVLRSTGSVQGMVVT